MKVRTTVACNFFSLIKGLESFKVILKLLLKLFRNFPVRDKCCWVSDLWIVPERFDRRLASLLTIFCPFCHHSMLSGSCLSVDPGRKFFSSPNLATGFDLPKRWKLPTARGRMLSVSVTVIASAFLPHSVCAPCSSAQR